MFTLILIAGIIAYIGAGSWAFGYAKGATEDKENGWETPLPILSAVFWPFLAGGIVLSYVILPAQQMGFAFQQAKLNKKKQRIAMQEKVRIELQEAEKELEAQFQELAEEENRHQSVAARPRKRTAARSK